MAAQTRKRAVGDAVEVKKDRELVVRPDGTELKVVGGVYYLDAPGLHQVDGATYEAE
jgi:hypothetical protein